MAIRKADQVVDVVRETVVEGSAAPVTEAHVHDHAEASTGESEYVATHQPWDNARGWLRFSQSVIAFALLLVESALVFRLVFGLTGANPSNGFVNFIYDVTRPFVAPFEGIANEQTSGDGVFEPETVIAMAVWALGAILLIGFLNIVMSAPTPDERTVVRESRSHLDRTV